jgi:hypothetical protein
MAMITRYAAMQERKIVSYLPQQLMRFQSAPPMGVDVALVIAFWYSHADESTPASETA